MVIASAGKYRRDSQLGAGHFGEVYKARDVALDVDRALKVIQVADPDELADKLKEARILQVCKHDNIVDVKEADVYEVDGEPSVVIATELLANGSVEDLLEDGFIQMHRTRNILCDALFGLEHLHINDIAHCDIKPGNILLGDNYTAKLSDFGLAVRIQEKGPPRFYRPHIAPEDVGLGNQGTKEGDIYAMGVTAYRLFNNISDFSSRMPKDLGGAVKTGKFPDRKGYAHYVPKKIKRIVDTAMRIDPKKRYASASKFREALEAIKFAIDWERIAPYEWTGTGGDAEYSVYADQGRKGWFVDFKKNGRRQRKHCKNGLPSKRDAIAFLEKTIADTALH